jgi:hypothetical protein
MKTYAITLAGDERVVLGQQVSSGRGPACELTRARILLKADSGPDGPRWTDGAIATALDVSVSTVARVRRHFANGELDEALRRRPPRREYRRAHVIKDPVDVHYRDAERVVLVLDNLNTHIPAATACARRPREGRKGSPGGPPLRCCRSGNASGSLTDGTILGSRTACPT